MIKSLRLLKYLAVLGLLEIALTAIGFQAVQAQLPPPPDTGTPTGDPTPATTRPQTTCPVTNRPLTALIANKNQDYTNKEYPTVWFYIPYSSQQISQLEFVLLDGSERQTIYRTAIKLTDKPGFIAVTIPSQPQYALQSHQLYRWYLMVDCQNTINDEPALVVNGWIRRMPNSSSESTVVPYDTIHELAQQHFANPKNEDINQAWDNLLRSLGYGWLVEESLADLRFIAPWN